MYHEFNAFSAVLKVFVMFQSDSYIQPKVPNGTFEQVHCVADEMAKLAEHCCQDDASLDCYDKRVSYQLC